jgi:hypothetical protein
MEKNGKKPAAHLESTMALQATHLNKSGLLVPELIGPSGAWS